MESESPHSLPSPPESPATLESETENGTSSWKRTRECLIEKPHVAPKTRSIYWYHCVKGSRKLVDGSTQSIGICNHCNVEIPTVQGSTSGLKNHLVKRCKLSPLYEGGSDKSQSVLTNEMMGRVFDLYEVGLRQAFQTPNLVKELNMKVGKLSTGDSLDMAPADESSIIKNGASLKDMEEWRRNGGVKL
ncbi:unnamed protein product [Cuscuta europaea]|uniref:BED-type domain-containing protein n=1 Tax=Cuscuta europaea TaxID=41803 RepID=A0A9P0ZUS7_CUSEU|nr:unnamed protein product [Cuscuta europaea]